jgi:hypothetical protein
LGKGGEFQCRSHTGKINLPYRLIRGEARRISVSISHRKSKITIQVYLIFQIGHSRFAIHDDLLF